MKYWIRIYLVLVIFLCVPPFLGRASSAQGSVPFLYNDHGHRDPFWPLVSGSGAVINYENDLILNDLTLEGVVVGSDGKNLAMINGHILAKNDKIGEFMVNEITSQSVILLRGTEKLELHLKKEE